MTVEIELDENDFPVESLEYLEEQLFYKFDKAFKEYHIDGHPTRDEIRAYRESLELVTNIRKQIETQQTKEINNSFEEFETNLTPNQI